MQEPASRSIFLRTMRQQAEVERPYSTERIAMLNQELQGVADLPSTSTAHSTGPTHSTTL